MGMRSDGQKRHPDSYTTLLIQNGIYVPIHPSKQSRHYNAIDCGTNEEMFIAMAAIRNDNDKYQWFICLEDCLNLDIEPTNKGSWQFNDRYDKLPVRLRKIWKKATMKEIVKHYGSKNQE